MGSARTVPTFRSPVRGHRNDLPVSSVIAYRACFVLLLVSGRLAARLAADFRVLAEHRERFGLLTVLLQLPVFLCWLLVRPISVAAYTGCRALAPRLQS